MPTIRSLWIEVKRDFYEGGKAKLNCKKIPRKIIGRNGPGEKVFSQRQRKFTKLL
tara:strand:+ start:977 stop:1141 length:165 start_codon:yes stop_codon:yes gene_type:complete